MLAIGAAVLIVLVALGIGPALAQTAHHEISVKLWPDNGRLEATDRVTGASADPFVFRLAPSLEVQAVAVDGQPAIATKTGDLWRVDATARADQELSISWQGQLPSEPGEPPFLGPEGGFLAAGAGWLPDLGSGEAAFDVEMKVPAPNVAVVTGDLVSETTADGWYTARFQAAQPGPLPTVFVGPYVVDQRFSGGVRIRTYFYAEQAELAPTYLAQAARYLEHFSHRIGDYPYRDFHIVAAPVPVGLGFPRATYVARQILHLPFMQTRSLAHEILHSWWGNAVAVDYAKGNWAEGLTTYMADYGLIADDDPEQAQAMRFDWLRDFYALPKSRDVPLRMFVAKEHDAAQVVGYDKAAFVFHMLERHAGDDTFDAAIQRFWQAHRGGSAGWADLEAAFSQQLVRGLGPFFEQWLERAGAPRLYLVQASSTRSEQGYQVALTLGQDAPPYRLLVPVEIETDAGTERFQMWIEGREAKATFQSEARPVAVAIDPDYDIFRRLDASEAPPILRDVTLGEKVQVLTPVSSPAIEDLAGELAERMVDGDIETLAQAGGRSGTDPLLIIGLSDEVRQELARAELPSTPERLAGRGSARVWTTRPAGSAAILVVEADDEAALRSLLRPLPHYGRNSYLVFEGSSAIEQGVWPQGKSPLRRRLD